MTVVDDATVRYWRERAQLLALAHRITRSPDEAEDVLQDVWIRYDAHRDGLVNHTAWLRTATSRAAIDRTRACSRWDTTSLKQVAPTSTVTLAGRLWCAVRTGRVDELLDHLITDVPLAG